jgi:hypothetical protein
VPLLNVATLSKKKTTIPKNLKKSKTHLPKNQSNNSKRIETQKQKRIQKKQRYLSNKQETEKNN